MARSIGRVPLLGELFSAYSNAKFLAHCAAYRELHSYLRSIGSDGAGPGPERRVVFNLGHLQNQRLLLFESFLAAKLTEYGYQPTILVNDVLGRRFDGLSVDDRKKVYDIPLRTRILRWILGVGDDSTVYRPYSEFLLGGGNESGHGTRGEDPSCPCSDEHQQYIEASVVRFFKSAPGMVQNEEDYPAALLDFAGQAEIGRKVAERVDEVLDPELVVTSHAIYTSWGPFYRYFKEKGKRVIVYGLSGVKDHSAAFSDEGVTLCEYDGGYFREKHREMDFADAQEWVDRTMQQRFRGRGMDLKAHELPSEEAEYLDRLLEEAGSEKMVAMFPGVLWEGRGPESAKVFESRVDWLLETVERFRSRQERLIVRAHPAEVHALRARVGVEDVLKRHFDLEALARDGIIVCEADAPLKSYELFPHIVAGIVYDGTIGLELMYGRIPVLTAGRSVYSELSFVYPISDREAYFRALDDFASVLEHQEQHREVLIKYLHYYFDTRFLKIPLLKLIENGEIAEIPPQEVLGDPVLTRLVETMVGRRRYFQECGPNGR